MSVRTGIGVDSHRFAPDRRLVLGGIEIPHELGLAGHSDADVLTHAVIDAILGAAGLGDIGEHFPDTDPAFAGADSLHLLATVLDRVAAEGWTVVHVDATIAMERPKLKPHKAQIGATLAAAMGVAPDAVNVKASTAERMGFVGREEGVAALAVATLRRP